jgi:hypothetical protein
MALDAAVKVAVWPGARLNVSIPFTPKLPERVKVANALVTAHELVGAPEATLQVVLGAGLPVPGISEFEPSPHPVTFCVIVGGVTPGPKFATVTVWVVLKANGLPAGSVKLLLAKPTEMLATEPVPLVTAVLVSVANAALAVPGWLPNRETWPKVTPPIERAPVLMKLAAVVKFCGTPPLTVIVKNESACADVVRLSTRIDDAKIEKRVPFIEVPHF